MAKDQSEKEQGKEEDKSSIGIPDLPLCDLSNDDDGSCLGLANSAKALATFIANCATPMTIGIQGDWGTGKTSLMQLIEQQITMKKISSPTVKDKEGKPKKVSATPVIWFNTWQYSQLSLPDRLPFALLANLIRKLNEEAIVRGADREETRGRFLRFGRSLAKIGLETAQRVSGKIVSDVTAGLISEDFMQGLGAEHERIDEAQLMEKMKEDFAGIVKAVTKAPNTDDRVVYFIDDLDRLEPVRAIELLEVIKNFVDVPGNVFVLAIDYDVVLKGLKQRKGYSANEIQHADQVQDSEGKSFFDKIIQVPYRMPTDTYDIVMFLGEKWGVTKIDEKGKKKIVVADGKKGKGWFVLNHGKELIENSVGRNPRSIKRLLNLNTLLTELIKIGAHGKIAEGTEIDLLILTSIQMGQLQMYQLLTRHHESIDLALLAFMYLPDIQNIAKENPNVDKPNLSSLIAAIKVKRADQKNPASTFGNTLQDYEEEDFSDVIYDLMDQFRKRPITDNQVMKMSRLARLLWVAVDGDEKNKMNGKFDEKELRQLEKALKVLRSTSVQKEDGEEGEQMAQTRCRLSFKDLCVAGVMTKVDSIQFYYPRENRVFPEEFVKPDYSVDKRFRVVDKNGTIVSLATATKNAIDRLVQRPDLESVVSEAEKAGKLDVRRWWVVDENNVQVSIATLADQYFEQKSSDKSEETEETSDEQGEHQ